MKHPKEKNPTMVTAHILPHYIDSQSPLTDKFSMVKHGFSTTHSLESLIKSQRRDQSELPARSTLTNLNFRSNKELNQK